MKDKELIAIDIKLNNVKSKGTAYYRLPEKVKEFFEECHNKHGIIGFSWEPGSWDFGVILKEDTA